MASTDIYMRILMSATSGNTLSVIQNVTSSLGSSGLLGAIGAVVIAVGALAIGFVAASVKMAGDFQSAMNRVQALTGSSAQQMTYYNAQLMQLATNAGVAPSKLADGLYNVISAGYQGADAIRLLTLATEDSKIGMTDAATTTKSLTALLAQFNISASDATRVNGEMLETVTLGSGTFEQYAQNIVKSASAASQFGVSLETMNAAYATLTSSQISAGQASTDFQQSLKVMYGNINTVVKSLDKNGIAFDENAFNAANYGDKVKMLDAALDEAHAKHVSITGVTLQAAQAIHTIATHMDVYNKNLSVLSDRASMAKKTQDAWATTQSGFNQQMDRANAAVQVLMINIGNAFIPVLTLLMSKLTPLIVSFSDWAVKNDLAGKVMTGAKDAINGVAGTISFLTTVIHDGTTAVQGAIQWWQAWHDPIMLTAMALGVYFGPALIQAGVNALISGAQITTGFIASVIQAGTAAVVNAAKVTYDFVASLIMAGAEGWASAAKLAVFIGSMIATGAQAAYVSAIVYARFVGSMIATSAQAVATGAVVVAKFVWSLIVAGAQAIATGAQFIASLIPAIISVATEATIAAVSAIPELVIGFGAWAIGASTAAIATIAATWPILLIIAAIALLVVAIVWLVTHWGQATKFMQGAWVIAMTWLVGALKTTEQIFMNVWNGLIKFFHQAWIVIQNIAKIAVITLLAVILGPIGLLVVLFMGPLHGLWVQIQNWFDNLVHGAYQSAQNFINMLVSGIEQGSGAIWNAVTGIAKTIWNALGFHSPPASGPLADSDEYMPNLIKMLSGGLVAGIPKMQQAANQVASPLATSLSGGGSTTISQGGNRSVVVGGHTFNISVSTMARSQTEVSRLVDMIEEEIARRFRGQTAGYASGGLL